MRSAALVSMAMVRPADASTVAVQSIAGGSNCPAFNGTNQTIGWAFTTAADIWVTDLGFLDLTPANGLTQSHQVGLWTLGGTLLTSVTVQTTSTLVGSFRYEAVTPVFLASGSSFVIGAEVTSPFTDAYTVPASFTTAPEIVLTGSARSASSSGFAAPLTVTAGTGRFGPNFQFTTTDVPPCPSPPR